MKNIVLIGFMGSGKTEVGKRLAERLSYTFVDTDRLIEEKRGESVAGIFRGEGEPRFRELEVSIIRDLLIRDLSGVTGHVISTGGGIVISSDNIRSLKKIGLLVWLKASPETIYRRVRSETHRPLLNVDDPLGEIKRLLTFREQFYSEADISVDTDGLEVDKIVDVIIDVCWKRR